MSKSLQKLYQRGVFRQKLLKCLSQRQISWDTLTWCLMKWKFKPVCFFFLLWCICIVLIQASSKCCLTWYKKSVYKKKLYEVNQLPLNFKRAIIQSTKAPPLPINLGWWINAFKIMDKHLKKLVNLQIVLALQTCSVLLVFEKFYSCLLFYSKLHSKSCDYLYTIHDV